VTLVVTDQADHVGSWNVDPERYAAILDAYLSTVTGPIEPITDSKMPSDRRGYLMWTVRRASVGHYSVGL
jgi:hypothetical protein